MLTRIEVCSNCRFWKPDVIAHGFCKRHAPAAVPAPKLFMVSVTVFPKTAPDDWCGDFQLKEKQDYGD